MKKLVLLLILTVVATALPAVAGEDPASEVFALYASMHHAMAGDTVDGVRDAARKIHDMAAAEAGRATDPAPWKVLTAAAETVDGTDLATLRDQFKGFSKAMALFVNATGVGGAQLWHCGMADGYWLQPEGEGAPSNPYYGSAMSGCGSKVDEVKS